MKSRQNEGRAYQEWDEDADVDESGEVLLFSKTFTLIRDLKSFAFCCTYCTSSKLHTEAAKKVSFVYRHRLGFWVTFNRFVMN